MIPHTVTPQISASARAVGEVRPRSVGQLGPSSSAKEALRYLIIALIAAMSIGGKDVPLGSAVCIRRDDGTDRTLLRARPTNSRSDDAFVAPKVAITSDDRLQLLQRTAAEGCAFSLVRTSSGVEGYVQSKYIALAPAPAAVGFDASSILASGGHTQFRPCGFQRDCSKAACPFHHFSPASAYSRPSAVSDDEFKQVMCRFSPCTKAGGRGMVPLSLSSVEPFA